VVNPGSRLDDGKLEVVTFESGPLWRTLAAAPRLFLGGLERAAGYRRVAGSLVTVTASAPVAVHCDGDPSEAAERVEVELRPGLLEIVVPAATASDPDGPFSA
jgi:diacylglycerol kinase family enzyme